MRTGQRRHLITIQRPTKAKNTFGDVENTWADLTTRWGSLEQVSTEATTTDKQPITTDSFKVVMLHYDVRKTDRLKIGSRIFAITGSVADDHQRYLTVMVKEVV